MSYSRSISFEMGSGGFNSQTPRIVRIQTNAPLSVVTTAGWIKQPPNNNVEALLPSDKVEAAYSQGTSLAATDFFNVAIVNGVVTLSVADTSVTLPTIADHIAVFSNTSGGLTQDPATAISGGNIQAGLSGTAGYFASFPATALNGSFRFAAVGNAGNYLATFSPVSTLAQATTYTLADPANAIARVLVGATATPFTTGHLLSSSGTGGLVADSGIAVANVQQSTNIKAAAIAWGGGGTSNAFTITGLTTASIVIPAIQAQATGTVYIESYTVTANTLTVTFSSDPGAMVLQYVAFIAPQ